jgi:hypothetical protein
MRQIRGHVCVVIDRAQVAMKGIQGGKGIHASVCCVFGDAEKRK